MPSPASISAALVHEELSRLIDSDALRRAPSHTRLLRYLVEKRLAGDDAALRETSIALEVFRRDPAAYDPQTDPIVRVTTGRLRVRLEAHYGRFELPPKLRIVLPKGRYAPEFVGEPNAGPAALGVAVLRTRNHTGDPEHDPRCVAFADALADHLARAGLPRVIARTSVDEAESRSREPSALGTRLDALWLVDSTLAREHEGEVRLSVRLVHAADASVRWVETAIGTVAELHRLTDRMLDLAVTRTAETLPGPGAVRTPGHRLAGLPERERAALDRARLLLLQRSLDGTDEALALIETVVSGHPLAADAWAALAAAQYSRLSFMDQDLGPRVERLRVSLDRALSLDAEQPVALRTKAIIVGKYDYRAAEAETLFQRVLRTMPHYTSARLNYAEILTMRGKFDDALAQLNLARIYDPLSLSLHLAWAHTLSQQRRYDEAREAWALCRAGGEASLWVLTGSGLNELYAGELDAAQRRLDEAVARFPAMPSALICHAYLDAARGDAVEARRRESMCIARFPHYSKANRAVLAGLLNDRASALAMLDGARAEHDMDLLQAIIQPAFDWLCDDPEFTALLARFGLRPHDVPRGVPRASA